MQISAFFVVRFVCNAVYLWPVFLLFALLGLSIGRSCTRKKQARVVGIGIWAVYAVCEVILDLAASGTARPVDGLFPLLSLGALSLVTGVGFLLMRLLLRTSKQRTD